MGVFRTILLLGVVTSVATLLLIKYISIPPELPVVVDHWWGRGKPGKDDTTVRRFKIDVPDAVLGDLKNRLERPTRLTDPLEDIGFQYGFNTKYLQQVVKFWKDQYNWRQEEKRLNQLPQFKTQIEGLDIHFLHVKPDQKLVEKLKLTVVPLLMVHGWPGSIVEFYKVLPLLTTPRKDFDFVFEVVCPSIPGYGFSEGAHKPGLGPFEVAQIFKKLMDRLGYEQYYLQGGDWGSFITSTLAKIFPEKALGLHINMVAVNTPITQLKQMIGSWWPSLVMDPKDAYKLYPLTEKFGLLLRESGYMHIQATKPDTVGVALNDSPVGLAAYILEKFSIWTRKKNYHLSDGGLTEKFTLTELLTNIMVYWVSGSITTSVRLYSENFSSRHYNLHLDRIPCNVPTGVAAFPEELILQPEAFVRDGFPQLVSYTDMPRGGHFAALEEPALLADDVWNVYEKIEKPKKGKDK